MFGFTLFSQLVVRASKNFILDEHQSIHEQNDYQSPKNRKNDEVKEEKKKKKEKKEKGDKKSKKKKKEKKTQKIKELFIPAIPINKESAIKFIQHEKERKRMIDVGIDYAKLYLKYLKN